MYSEPSRSMKAVFRTTPRRLCLIALLVLITTSQSAFSEYPTTTRLRADTPQLKNSSRILVMPVDVELYEMSMGGLVEPRADWTESARSLIENALEQNLSEHVSQTDYFKEPTENTALFHDYAQLQKLNSAVGETIYLHAYEGWQTPKGEPSEALPTKGKTFDWSLGPGIQKITAKQNVDYVLFTHFRDVYATAARKTMWFTMAAMGVAIQSSHHEGFISLVDAHSGDIVWFNRIVSGAGDLRLEQTVNSTMNHLLRDIPL